ncbi:MAG: ABC transporter permease, partial [Candidatus Levybacteria bacterium]|nr:ABC transporter permease [Candidatus Levybacteria bacterium]
MKYIAYLVKSSLMDFRRNKVRTFLTSLGILIGVLSVVLMMAFGFGLKAYIDKEFETMGKNLIMILPGAGFKSGGQGLIGGVQFDEKDLAKIRRVKNIEIAAPAFAKSVKIEANGKAEPSNLRGTTPAISKLLNLEFDKGRMFTETDLTKKKKVVVIGGELAVKLFGSSSNAINKTVRIQNQRFMVIGTLMRKGSLGSEVDTISIAPYTSLLSLNP